jgi:hypothetical protein
MRQFRLQGREGMREARYQGPLPGIVIHGREDLRPATPRIHAFIWGGKVRPTPTLRYGRQKDVA